MLSGAFFVILNECLYADLHVLIVLNVLMLSGAFFVILSVFMLIVALFLLN